MAFTVLLTRDDVLRILAGTELNCGTDEEGTFVQVRMYTAEEFHAAHVRSVNQAPEEQRPPIMSFAQVAKLVEPIDLLTPVDMRF